MEGAAPPSWQASQARERISRETDRLRRVLPRPPILSLQELSQDGHHLRVELAGPDGSPFAGARFGLELQVGSEYPFRPPAVRFASPRRVFHPNICPKSGGICLDILNNSTLWSPAIGLEKLLLGISSLLSEPRTEHGLNAEALELLRSDPDAFARRAATVAGVAAPSLSTSGDCAAAVDAGATALDALAGNGAAMAAGEAATARRRAGGAVAKPAAHGAMAPVAPMATPLATDLSTAFCAAVLAVLAAVVVALRFAGQ